MFNEPVSLDNQLAAEEAIQLLKIEIIAQDWSLSSRRGSAIGEALKVLYPLFSEQKGARYILDMTKGALDHITLHGRETAPDVIDFLKAAMANIVILFEDEGSGESKEVELFHRTYKHFKKLKAEVARTKKIR